jgi:hypothetical protein
VVRGRRPAAGTLRPDRAKAGIARRLGAGLGVVLALGGPPPAPVAARPTDVVRVDDFIGAPRALFGRTEAEVRRALGEPPTTAPGAVASYRDPARLFRVSRLAYPGLTIEILETTGRVRRVRIGAPGRGLPFGLDVGASREDVERTLGEPQEDADRHLMYLYADGFPDTVHFHLRDGRVRLIEWNYGSAE